MKAKKPIKLDAIGCNDTELLDKCVIENHALNYFLREMCIVEALQDPSKTAYLTLKGGEALFTLTPYGEEEYKYHIYLKCGLGIESGEPFMHALTFAVAPGANEKQFLTKNAVFKISPSRRLRLIDTGKKFSASYLIRLVTDTNPTYKTLKPTDLGVSRETAIVLIGMDQPISAGMARNITATETIDFDFSEVLA